MSYIEYFYASHSVYAYLGSRQLLKIAAKSGRRILHKPYDLHLGIIASGSKPIGERTQNYLDYFFVREVERWSEIRAAPILKPLPTHHHKSIAPSNKMLISASLQGINIDLLAHKMMEQHWRYDADLADKDTLELIARSLQLDPKPILQASESKTVTDIYEANTKEAINRSVFGSPTYFVDGDMFYGQDRLDLMEHALTKPFSNQWNS